MKRSLIVIYFIFMLVLLLGGGQLFAKTVAKKCCVAGIYQGTHKDTLSKKCPDPKAADFTMEIIQSRNCSQTISGTMKDPDGTLTPFKGKAIPGSRNCCKIEGRFGKRGDVTEFKGTLCQQKGKWIGKGTYQNQKGCKGKWEMLQQ